MQYFPARHQKAVEIKNIALSTFALITLFSLFGCFKTSNINVSVKGRELCRERRAESPPGTSMEERQKLFETCLRSIERELQAQAQQELVAERAAQEKTSREATTLESITESAITRLQHCRIVQQQVIDVDLERIRRLGPLIVATRKYGSNSPELYSAQRDYDATIIKLEQLIPESMRGKEPLVPNAILIFKRCDPSDFYDKQFANQPRE